MNRKHLFPVHRVFEAAQQCAPNRESGVSVTIYGYVRVSTDKQETGSDAQRRALAAAGCDTIREERASGRKARPVLAKLVSELSASDVLTVYRFDRISRGVADFYAIGQRIRERGASLRSLVEHFDTSTPIGKAMMGFAAVWAELEADTTRERVRNGLAAARARGIALGRRRALSQEQESEVLRALHAGTSLRQLAGEFGVSPSTIHRTKKSKASSDSE